MLFFAHNGIEHASGVESAAHNLTGLAIVSLGAAALLGLTIWLLNRKPAPPETQSEEEDS